MKKTKRNIRVRLTFVLVLLSSLVLSSRPVLANGIVVRTDTIKVEQGDFSINPEDMILMSTDMDTDPPISREILTDTWAADGIGIEISDEFKDILHVMSIETTDNEDLNQSTSSGITLEVIEVTEGTAEGTDFTEDIEISDVSDNSSKLNTSEPMMPENQIAPIAALPDLQVTAMIPTKEPPYIGMEGANFEVVIANTGNAPANAFSYELQTNGQIIGSLATPGIAAGGSRTFSLTIGNLPAGSHTFTVVADCTNAVAESNENNNSKTGTYTWTGDPDLTIKDFTISSLNPAIGEAFYVDLYISNKGNADINKIFYVDILINGSILARIDFQGLGARKTKGTAIMFAFDTNGVYNIQAKADSTYVIAESNESNNTSVTYTVKPKKAAQIRISGQLQYFSYEVYTGAPTLNYLSNYQVKIYEKGPSSSTVKATITTDANGNFSTVINNTSSYGPNGCSLYLGVPMDNPYVKIIEPNKSQTYELVSPTYENWMKDKLDMGTLALAGSEVKEGVANIYHWIKAAKDFYQSKASQLGKMTVVWAPDMDKGSHYDPNALKIYLNGVRYGHKNATIITHEYGHYIMSYKNVSPFNAGGIHSFASPCENIGTAYSEAYASFISMQVRNKTTYDEITSTLSMSANFETLRYTQKGSAFSNTLVNRRPIFYENGKMELFTGGAMLDFADDASDGLDTYNGGFKDVNDIVMSKRLSNSVEFYDAYMKKVSTGNKILAWKIFNQNNSAFDYNLPMVIINGNRNIGFTAQSADDVGVEVYEWYLDGSLMLYGPAYYKPPTNLSAGTHTVMVRAYDYEGVARKNTSREDMYGRVVRTLGYGSEQTQFSVTSSTFSGKNNTAGPSAADVAVKLFESADFASAKSFDFSGIHQDEGLNKEALMMDLMTIDNNTDLYITGSIEGAINSINIINADGETEDSIDGLFSNEYTVLKNLPAGDYTLQIDAVDSRQQIPYYINIFVVPSAPEISIPKTVAGTNTLELHNPYSNLLQVIVNRIEYCILPDETKEIFFDEGENKLVYYSENNYGKSEMVEKMVYCDTIAPVVELKKAVSDGEILVITGQISEYADLYINNEQICLGEYNNKDEPITFTYISPDVNTSVLDIKAIDAYSNPFTTSVNLQR